MLGLKFLQIASETPSVISRSIEDHKAIVQALRQRMPMLRERR
jgi:hypothetical protein